MIRQIFTLLLCTLLAVPLPAVASTYTALPTVTFTAQMQSYINALNYYNNILKAGGRLSSSQMTNAGYDIMILANLFEQAGITAKIDAWVRANQTALLAHYTDPAKQTAIKYAANYGSHYVLYANGTQVKDAAGTRTGGGPHPWATGCVGARVVADAAGIVGTVLSLAGGPETPWGAIGFGLILGGALCGMAIDILC